VKWSLTIVAIISISVLLILVANSLFLGDFYTWKNKTLFYQEYENLKVGFEQPDRETLAILRENDRRTGFLFYIAEMSHQNLGRIVLASGPNFVPEDTQGLSNAEIPQFGLPNAQFDYILHSMELFQQGEPLFGQVQRDMGGKMQFDLVFAAPLNTQYLLIIVRPVEQLDEHTAIINQFLLIIGLLTILVSILIARLSAKSVAQPIKEITDIGKHIANLDFSHRYTGNARDEIGSLGNSINTISTKLDSAIRELEETNRKLQIEMSLQKQFFAGVSHEFKTPVGLIRGYSESLVLGLAKTPQEIVDFSAIILDETDKLNRLVSDILFLVRSESAEFVLDLETLDIVPLLEDSLKKNAPMLLDKQISLMDELPQSILVTGDAMRLRQVFDNLLSNAFRHTPKGGRILIKAIAVEKGMKFCVLNEGEAIAENHIDHLFDPFYTTFESRDKASSGTGLGLSIVRNLVEKHHGRCGIENVTHQDFKGVQAWFFLPIQPN
jgi:signal transduction histidine kinase